MVTKIIGGVAQDHRGEIRFINDFDMTLVKRFYVIRNVDTELVRGWRAHKIEQRWFYVLSGMFEMELVKIDDWGSPSRTLPIETRILNAGDQQVIHVPAGYGTAFRAREAGSVLLVFADYGIEHAPLDDYTWSADYFTNYIK